MGRYIQLTKPYLVIVTIFVVLRFVLEVAGVAPGVTSEISFTRLVLVIAVFLGLRFAREGLGGFKDMLMASFVYCFWGILLIMIITALDVTMGLNTHYALGPDGEVMPLGQHLIGHIFEIVVLTLILAVISLIASKLGPSQPANSPA